MVTQPIDVVVALEQSRQYLLEALAGLTDDRARRTPASGGWSVLDCVEHIGLSEARMVGFAQQDAKEVAPPIDKAREAHLAAVVADRTAKRAAPEPVQPTGRFTTLDEAVAQFNATRSASVVFAQQKGAALYAISVTHPAMGLLNGAEVMALIAGHTRRHADQIREILAAV